MPPWQKVLPTRDEQVELKREALYREAAIAFNRKGFHGTTLDDIARKLGVTKAALYRYVPSKHELLFRCHNAAMDAAFTSLERGRALGADGLEKLRLTLRGYLEHLVSDLGYCVVLLEENALLPDHAAAIIRRRDEFERALRGLVREGIADGSVVPCDPKLAVFAMLGAINWVPKWFSGEGPWSGAQLAEALTELATRAIAARPAPALATDVGATTPARPASAVSGAASRETRERG